MRRVVITGLGAVTPLANDAKATWEGLLAGESGVDHIESFDASSFPVQIAAEVKGYDPTGAASPKEVRRLDRNVLFALTAAKEAMEDAGINGGYRKDRIGAVIGCGIGSFNQMLDQYEVYKERGPARVSPYFLPNILVDSPSGQLAVELGIRGPNYAIVAACATGHHTVGEGAELIKRGDADAILAGGTESCMHPLILAGFCSMKGVLVQNGESDPAAAMRPFDARRSGFVMAEGAGVLLLEEYEAAVSRGATIYAEVLGYGASNDAYHMAAPDPESVGVGEMIRTALRRAELEPEQVDYVNAHGTATLLGDAAETKAIKEVFGDHAYNLAVSSTKSMTGHMFAAAGAIETMATALSLHHSVLPPTINYGEPDPECDLDYVPNEPREVDVQIALSNGMGLGGHNGCVLLGKVA